MFDEVIGSIGFSTVFEGEEVELSGLKHRTVPFSNSNFHEIKGGASGAAKGKLAFVDGGNNELIKTPNFSLQLCRIAYVVFENNMRIKQERKEFYVLVHVADKKFIAKTFGADFDFKFNIDDENFKSGKSNGSPGSVVSAIRRFAELQLAGSLEADAIVLDGSLKQSYTFEDKFLEHLTNKNVLGFCKTCSLLTKSGNSAVALMNLHKGKFSYHPVAELFDESYRADICFARLHENSDYVFKIDFSRKIDENIMNLLAENSKDPVFIGYPYGLVLADKLARISDEEAGYLRTKFISRIKNKDLLRYLNALNAHDVLDNM